MVYTKNNNLHIVSVVAVIRNNEGKYLILKRGDHEIAYPGKYTFPGGKVENNDTVEETLAREVEEEAGLQIKPGKTLLKDKSFVRPDTQTVKVFSYFCELEENNEVKISKDFSDYKWVNLEELKQLEHVGIEEELIIAEQLITNNIPLNLIQTKSGKE